MRPVSEHKEKNEMLKDVMLDVCTRDVRRDRESELGVKSPR